MKFSTQEDIEAPVQDVFDMLCDFENFERAAMRRGAEVQRTDALGAPGVGAAWQARFFMRGRLREIELTISKFDAPSDLVLAMRSAGMLGDISFGLIALSRSRTRMIVGLELRPQSLQTRLLIQSLKLTKGTLTTKYKDRVKSYVRDMEERHARTA